LDSGHARGQVNEPKWSVTIFKLPVEKPHTLQTEPKPTWPALGPFRAKFNARVAKEKQK